MVKKSQVEVEYMFSAKVKVTKHLANQIQAVKNLSPHKISLYTSNNNNHLM